MLRRLTLVAAIALAGPAAVQAAPPAPAPAPATPTPTPAPATPEPQRTTATYGDWVLGCLRPDKGAATCELVQNLFNQGNPFARTVIGRPARGEPLRLAIAVPVNVNLTVAPHMMGAESETGFAPVELAWRRCLQQVCVADMPLPDELLKKLRTRTDNARITFTDAGGKEAVLPFGPRGLAQGIEALVKEEGSK